MDQNTLVDGGDEGLRKIADLFREAGFPVVAIYLAKRTDSEGSSDWRVVAVMSPFRPSMSRDFLYELVRLRRDGKLPYIAQGVRLEAVSVENVEADRVLEYARLIGRPPLVIRDAYHRGISIEHALVAEDRRPQAQAA